MDKRKLQCGPAGSSGAQAPRGPDFGGAAADSAASGRLRRLVRVAHGSESTGAGSPSSRPGTERVCSVAVPCESPSLPRAGGPAKRFGRPVLPAVLPCPAAWCWVPPAGRRARLRHQLRAGMSGPLLALAAQGGCLGRQWLTLHACLFARVPALRVPAALSSLAFRP